jgi:hypothetical protein
MQVKVNSTLALTLILLSLMIGAGVVSAAWGYALGREALKGVTQPDSRPAHEGTEAQGNAPHRQELVLLKESEIIENVKAQTSGRGDGNQSSSNSETKALTASPSPSATATEVSTSAEGFPITSESHGVTLAVRSARQQGGYLLLDVSLQNNGSQPVQFLYSFMNVTDDRGRAFSANTEGLPGRIPPGGQPLSGVVSIPTALLDNAETLSLTLTDYPDQQLQLQVADIPVVR